MHKEYAVISYNINLWTKPPNELQTWFYKMLKISKRNFHLPEILSRKPASIYDSDDSRVAQNLVTESNILTRFLTKNHNNKLSSKALQLTRLYTLSKQRYFIVTRSVVTRNLRVSFSAQTKLRFRKSVKTPVVFCNCFENWAIINVFTPL